MVKYHRVCGAHRIAFEFDLLPFDFNQTYFVCASIHVINVAKVLIKCVFALESPANDWHYQLKSIQIHNKYKTHKHGRAHKPKHINIHP